MANHLEVEFGTPAFSVVAGEDEETNPGIFGKAPSEWLAAALRAKGTEVSDVVAEDWGRCVIIHRKPFMLWLGCSNIDEAATCWRVFVVAELPIFGKLFCRTNPTEEISSLVERVRDIIPSIPQVSDIKWIQPE